MSLCQQCNYKAQYENIIVTGLLFTDFFKCYITVVYRCLQFLFQFLFQFINVYRLFTVSVSVLLMHGLDVYVFVFPLILFINNIN